MRRLMFAAVAIWFLSSGIASAHNTVQEDCGCTMPQGFGNFGFYRVTEKTYYVERFRGLPAVIRILRARGPTTEKVIIYQLVFGSQTSTVGTAGPIIRIVNDPDDYQGKLDPEEKPLFSLPLQEVLAVVLGNVSLRDTPGVSEPLPSSE